LGYPESIVIDPENFEMASQGYRQGQPNIPQANNGYGLRPLCAHSNLNSQVISWHRQVAVPEN
jgi:hypothetical protein